MDNSKYTIENKKITPLSESFFDSDETIMVSIGCLVYNHEVFLEQAIEGFLMQRTNFKVEIVIHDDASTDLSQSIIKKYEKRFPNIFKPIYQTENQFTKKIKVSQICLGACRGKYIALCEGDDYWTDPFKLQKQVDFLEENEDFAVCFHNYSQLINKKRTLVTNPISNLPKDKLGNIILKSIFDSDVWITQTCTVMFRAKLLEKYNSNQFKSPYGDFPFFYYLLRRGYGYWLNDNMAVYRVQEEGAYSKLKDETKKINMYNLYFEIYKNNLDDIKAAKYYKSNAAIMINDIKNGKVKSLEVKNVLRDALNISIFEPIQVLMRHYFYNLRNLAIKIRFK